MIGAVASGARFSLISVRCQSEVAIVPEATRRFSHCMEPANDAMKLSSGLRKLASLAIVETARSLLRALGVAKGTRPLPQALRVSPYLELSKITTVVRRVVAG